MKKYPVIYKGKEYEVRWEGSFYVPILAIYEVKTINIFGKFKIKIHEGKVSEYEDTIKELIDVSSNDPNCYIEEVKKLFEIWESYLKSEEEKNKTERIQKQSLAEWDGVIDE